MTTQTQWTRFDRDFLRRHHISLQEECAEPAGADMPGVESIMAVAMVMLLLMVFDWSWWKQ